MQFFSAVPLLIDFLIVRLTAALQGNWKSDKFINLVSVAFFSCFVADLMLGLDWISDNLFLVGMGFFFIGHIFFSTGFSINGEPWCFRRLIPPLIFAAITVRYLYASCKIFEQSLVFGIAVIIYATAETTMCWRALSRIGFNNSNENVKAQWLVGIGALFFMMCDLLLVSRKFCSNFPQGDIYRILYLSFYYPGLLIMAIGVAHRLEENFVLVHYFMNLPSNNNNPVLPLSSPIPQGPGSP